MSDAENPKRLDHAKGAFEKVEPSDTVIDVDVEIIEEDETRRSFAPGGQGDRNGW